MARLRRSVIALLLGVPVVLGLAGFLVARNQESAQKTALSVAKAVHAKGMEDALRYGVHCRDLQDWLILTKEGPTALWLYQSDSNHSLSLWLRRDQREPVSRVLRDMQWGPPPSDAELDYVLSVALNESQEMHLALRDLLLTYMCWQDLLITKAQRADIEKRIRFLATSSAPEDRAAYAHTQIASDTDSAPVLRPLLNDPAELPRARAIYALGRRNDPSLKAILPSLLDDPSREVRRAGWSVQTTTICRNCCLCYGGMRNRLLPRSAPGR